MTDPIGVQFVDADDVKQIVKEVIDQAVRDIKAEGSLIPCELATKIVQKAGRYILHDLGIEKNK